MVPRTIANTVAILAVAVASAFGVEGSGEVQANQVVVVKSEKRLTLYRDGTLIRSYRVALGKKRGPKARQGDCRTPEGRYVIDRRSLDSRFYKSLHISYPNPDDAAKARKSGHAPGGNVEIHGLPKGYEDLGPIHTRHNWTNGCIAVSNSEMDELWQLVPDGTPIEILP